MNSLVRGKPTQRHHVLSCLLAPMMIGQQDPFADIARASLSVSCNPNTNDFGLGGRELSLTLLTP